MLCRRESCDDVIESRDDERQVHVARQQLLGNESTSMTPLQSDVTSQLSDDNARLRAAVDQLGADKRSLQLRVDELSAGKHAVSADNDRLIRTVERLTTDNEGLSQQLDEINTSVATTDNRAHM